MDFFLKTLSSATEGQAFHHRCGVDSSLQTVIRYRGAGISSPLWGGLLIYHCRVVYGVRRFPSHHTFIGITILHVHDHLEWPIHRKDKPLFPAGIARFLWSTKTISPTLYCRASLWGLRTSSSRGIYPVDFGSLDLTSSIELFWRTACNSFWSSFGSLFRRLLLTFHRQLILELI